MNTWQCSHDHTHPLVEAEFNPAFCEARIGQRMTCGAVMQKKEDTDTQTPAAVITPPPTPKREGTIVSKLIQMSSGAPDIEEGNYVVTLTNLTGPREATMPDGESVTFFDWTFATEDGTVIEDSSTDKTGPKSKMRQWIAALIGRTPGKDEGFDPSDLIGRMAVVTIAENEKGWPRISVMGPLMQAPAAPAPLPTPQVAPPPAVPAGSPPELPLG